MESICRQQFNFLHTIPTFNNLAERAIWKHYGKRRKCRKPAFSSFPIIFSTISITIFTLAVFREYPRYCYSLGVVVVVIVQKILHFIISLITNDIYLKLWICVNYSRAIHIIKGDNSKCISLPNYAPFSMSYHLSSTIQPNVGTCMRCSCPII